MIWILAIFVRTPECRKGSHGANLTHRTHPENHAATLLNLSEGFSEIGSWVWTLEDNRVRWSAGLFRMLGLDPIHSDASWDLLDRLVHPDDRPKLHAAWESAAHSGSFCADIRVLVDGRLVPARSRASAIRDRSGRITGWIGVSVVDAPQSVTQLPADSQISAPLIRAARGLLDWTAMQLAENAGLSFSTVRRIEMPGPRSVRVESFIAVRTAFEKHGVQFLQLPDGRAGVACAT
jgi:hypothetical protein